MAYDPKKACNRKKWFATRKAAKASAKQQERMSNERLRIYKCDCCLGYHMCKLVNHKNHQIAVERNQSRGY
jgi:hypothetical protein